MNFRRPLPEIRCQSCLSPVCLEKCEPDNTVRKLFFWKLKQREIRLGERTVIMGVLNVTPDSFSDGGKYSDPDRAFARAIELGAEIINDPSCLTFEPQLARTVAQYNAGLVLNHMRGTPETWAKLG